MIALQQFHRIRNDIQMNQQKAQRGPIRFPEHIDTLLQVKSWDDVVVAIRRGVPQPALDGVVELFTSGQSAKQIARGLRPVLSDSLDNLYNRWHGLPEIKTVPRPTGKAATPSTNLVPFQLYKKQTLDTFAANSAAAKAAEVASKGGAISEDAESSLPNGAVTEDNGNPSEIGEAPEGDTSAADIVIYKALKEEESIEEALTEEKLASAKSIASWWKRCRRRRQLRLKEFSLAFKDALGLAASVPKTAPRRLDYMVMLLVSFNEHKTALDLLIKETEACKRKVRRSSFAALLEVLTPMLRL